MRTAHISILKIVLQIRQSPQKTALDWSLSRNEGIINTVWRLNFLLFLLPLQMKWLIHIMEKSSSYLRSKMMRSQTNYEKEKKNERHNPIGLFWFHKFNSMTCQRQSKALKVKLRMAAQSQWMRLATKCKCILNAMQSMIKCMTTWNHDIGRSGT